MSPSTLSATGLGSIMENGSIQEDFDRHAVPSETPMPIAVVGMACRLPGEASSVKGLWEMCCNGRSAWSEFPKDKISHDGFFHPDPSQSGCFSARGGHFLKEDVARFDAPFFNISPTEAQVMDPQQRLLLELTYEALENGGIPLKSIVSQEVGVYVGASMSDYEALLNKDSEVGLLHQGTGDAPNMLSNRLSYFFDLKGPSVTLDTACSSSLAALHLACQSLRAGETTQAIVGGVYVMLSPDRMIDLSRLRLFSEEGRSYSFDARANGYGRGEGVSTLVLKPLQDAIHAGDNIRAVIRNTGMNQDGRTPGITFPSQSAQASLIRSVYAAARLDPTETGYVEAHGTGTATGDPIEASAIAEGLSIMRAPENPLFIGSVKTNIGHLEAGSGLASMIKAILTVETGMIPPNANFEKPNPQIPLLEWRLKVPTALTPWPSASVRRASVSNFGFGGTNVHVILEAISDTFWMEGSPRQNGIIVQPGSRELENGAPQCTNCHQNGATELNGNSHMNGTVIHDAPIEESIKRRRIFVLTTSEKTLMKRQMQNLAAYLEERPEFDDHEMGNLAYTLAQRRSLLEWRTALPALGMDDLISALKRGDVQPTRANKEPRIGFVFTGQGSQWHAMGRELMVYPVFSSVMQEADKCLKDLGSGWSLLNELSKDAKSSFVNRAYLSQPATTAVQIALVSLLASWKIKPVAATGHSSGEIAAAFVAGALSLSSCMLIAYHRGAIVETLKERFPHRTGAMSVIGATPKDVQAMAKKCKNGKVDIACTNGPSLITISGDVEAVEDLQQQAMDADLLTRRLQVDVAYHSYHMNDVAADYLQLLGEITPTRSEHVDFFSSLKGQRTATCELTADYWVKNMVSPVRFVDAVEDLCDQGRRQSSEVAIDALVEIGPHSTLEAPIRSILKANPSWETKTTYLRSLVRNKDAGMTTLMLASSLFSMGCNVDLPTINTLPRAPPNRLLADLPSYPWMHEKRYWHESRLSRNHRLRRFPRNDILGSLVNDYNDFEPRWRNILRTSELPWLLHHKIQSATVFPLTGYLVMAIDAAYQRATGIRNVQVTRTTRYDLREITISRPMVLSDSPAVETSVTLRSCREGPQSSSDLWDEFCVSSWTDQKGWIEHCRGLISVVQTDGELNAIDGHRHRQAQLDSHLHSIVEMKNACTTLIDCDKMYEKYSEVGLQFGPSFQNMYEARACPGRCAGVLRIPDIAQFMPYNFERQHTIHPCLLDSCLHAIAPALYGGKLSSLSTLHVPTFVKQLSVSHGISNQPGDRLQVYATSDKSVSDRKIGGSLAVYDAAWKIVDPVIELKGYVASLLGTLDNEAGKIENRELCYKFKWGPFTDAMKQDQYLEIMGAIPEAAEERNQITFFGRASLHYVQKMLHSMPSADALALTDQYQKLYHHFKDQSLWGDSGSLHQQSLQWLECGIEEREQYLARFRGMDDASELLCRIGENLLGILRKEVDPLSIMLQDNLLEKLNHSVHRLNRSYAMCASWIATLAHQDPQMNILEVGAGTGSATGAILEAFSTSPGSPPRFSHYEFTDLLPGFQEKAKETFKEFGNLINYSILNIEEDPGKEGFQPASYDLIIASHVLHATKNVERAMRNVRWLLKPGGKLIVLETTNPKLVEYIFFGVLPGWWLGEEPERANGPTLDISQWGSLLQRTGFSVDACVPDHPSHSLVVANIIVATAVTEQRVVYPTPVVLYETKPQTISFELMSRSLKDLTEEKLTVASLAEIDVGEGYYILLEERPLWPHITEQLYGKMQSLFLNAKGVLWVLCGPESTEPETKMSIGFTRTLRAENTAIRVVTLDLDRKSKLSETRTADMIAEVFRVAFGSDRLNGTDLEFAERNGRLEIPRIVVDSEKDQLVSRETRPPVLEPQQYLQDGRKLKVNLRKPGFLDSLIFEDDLREMEPIGEDEVEIAVKVAGVNFKDVMIGLGQVPYHELGLECAGVVTALGTKASADIAIGDRVCAMTYGAFANFTRTPRHMVAKIPDSMSLTVAASIPIVFCTALYSLIQAGNLSKGESVLIHAAAGGVGQAAIMVAQMIGAEIFVTVGSAEKRDHIMEKYNIPEDHMFSSRDVTFAEGILRQTNNRGVDLILNSLAGEALRHSWNCVAPLGRFIEIGKRDLVLNNYLEMERFADSVTFTAVDIGTLASLKPTVFQNLLVDVIGLHKKGSVTPVSPITTYRMSELESAFRLLQSAKHMGKVVIEAREDDVVHATPALDRRAVVRPDASYLLTGGTGGLGRSITRWLARQGVRYIILLSRSGLAQKSARDLVEELGATGVKIAVYKCDIGDEHQFKHAINQCVSDMPPIRGVIHGAMVLQDKLFENTTLEEWNSIVRPRVQGAWNLHNHLSKTDLDFFILLASTSGLGSTRGQAAYSATNTFLDALASHRIDRGLPAASIDIGIVADVGYVAENQHRAAQFAGLHHDVVQEDELLAVIKAVILQDDGSPSFSSNDEEEREKLKKKKMKTSCDYTQTITGLKLLPDRPIPWWTADPRFSHLVRNARPSPSHSAASTSTNTGTVSPGQLLQSTTSMDAAAETMCQLITARVATVAAVAPEAVEPDKPLVALGLDSLVALEVRNWIAAELGATVPLVELMTSGSLRHLARVVAGKSGLVSEGLKHGDEKGSK